MLIATKLFTAAKLGCSLSFALVTDTSAAFCVPSGLIELL